MPYALNYCADKQESRIIDRKTKEAVAFNSEEKWLVDSFEKESDYIEAVKKAESISVSCFDITSSKSVETIEAFRKNNKEALLVIISDSTISPLVYMKPNVMASSLLLKPLNEMNISSCMNEVIRSYYSQKEEAGEVGTDKKFCVETKDGKRYVPFSSILYFEAREKKIFLNTKQSETGFYSNLETVLSQLPDCFVRCHRSFIVNTKKITEIQSSQNIICCEGEVAVPMSRSCKAAISETMGVNKR